MFISNEAQISAFSSPLPHPGHYLFTNNAICNYSFTLAPFSGMQAYKCCIRCQYLSLLVFLMSSARQHRGAESQFILSCWIFCLGNFVPICGLDISDLLGWCCGAGPFLGLWNAIIPAISPHISYLISTTAFLNEANLSIFGQLSFKEGSNSESRQATSHDHVKPPYIESEPQSIKASRVYPV